MYVELHRFFFFFSSCNFVLCDFSSVCVGCFVVVAFFLCVFACRVVSFCCCVYFCVFVCGFVVRHPPSLKNATPCNPPMFCDASVYYVRLYPPPPLASLLMGLMAWLSPRLTRRRRRLLARMSPPKLRRTRPRRTLRKTERRCAYLPAHLPTRSVRVCGLCSMGVGGGCVLISHMSCLAVVVYMSLDPRFPTMPGRSMSG